MQQIQDMIAEVDQDGDGSINYEEFVSVFLKKKLKPLIYLYLHHFIA